MENPGKMMQAPVLGQGRKPQPGVPCLLPPCQLETAGQRLTCVHRWPGVVLPEFYSRASVDGLEARALQARFSSVYRCSYCSCILASETILSNR